MAKSVKPAVKGLIEQDGRILILKTETENRTYWVLPGGKVEYGESPKETLRREIQEELSVKPEINEPVGMYHFFVGENDDGDQIVLTVFESEINTEEIDITGNPADENITDYEWLKPEEIIEKSSNNSLQKLIAENYRLKWSE